MCLPGAHRRLPDETSLEEYATFKHAESSSVHFEPLPEARDQSNVVTVSAVRCGNLRLPAYQLIHEAPGDICLPAFAFLVEKSLSDGKTSRILFDAGPRREDAHFADWHRQYYEFNNTECPEGLAFYLKTKRGLDPSDIDAIVLSHTHWDHMGQLEDWPQSDLVLGVDTEFESLDKLARELDVSEATLQSRKVKILSREGERWHRFGSMLGFDYFGDGSFVLLDAPGHMSGHIVALARTKAGAPDQGEDLYFILGGDSCHHREVLVTPNGLASAAKPKVGYWKNDEGPKAVQCYYTNLPEAYNTIAALERMQLESNLIVFLAHDDAFERLHSATGSVLRLPNTDEAFATYKEMANAVRQGSRRYQLVVQ